MSFDCVLQEFGWVKKQMVQKLLPRIAIEVNNVRVTCLLRCNDKEDEYFSVKPDFFKNIVGTHHCHANKNYTVIDFLEISKINF